MRRMLTAVTVAVGSVALSASPVLACGGLVGENGTIQLVRTTTLAAYHDGVERYVTNFEFTGEGEEVGSIIPLPDVPTDVVRGGDWTLQRLAQEVAPADERSSAGVEAVAAADEADVLFETQIDALDITVLRGGGDEVGRWASEHGYFLSPDAPEVLDFYADRSPIFLAARFDAARARELGQVSGDGTPIMVTIPTDDPWVPLRILGLGVDRSEVVEADVFLLTDDRPALRSGGDGLVLDRSEPASTGLLADLRSDVGMEWVPDEMWLSHLQLEERAGDLDYDLGVSTQRGEVPDAASVGVALDDARPVAATLSGVPTWPLAAGAGVALVVFLAPGLVGRRRGGHRTTGVAS